jgi:IMP dehydrogenase
MRLCFDDVLLEPQYSEIESRSDVDTSTLITPAVNARIPIIAANMDTISEHEMVTTMVKNGAWGILHRFYDSMNDWRDEIEIHKSHTDMMSFSVGVNVYSYNILSVLNRRMPFKDTPTHITIDIAHGHSKLMKDMITHIKETYPDVMSIIAGNVATGKAARDLRDWGADSIKVGIGPGSMCTTRIQTGCGAPQLSAIQEVCNELSWPRHKGKATVIADGGIRNSGDIVKALAAGADSVMVGSLFGGCAETPGGVHTRPDGTHYKVYRGQASFEAQYDRGSKNIHAEGVSKCVEYTNTNVAEILDNLMKGVRSGMSYCGAKNLAELRANAKFIQVSNSTLNENIPHGV